MKLWIIGNGFDLHHGLKTSYDDYKAFLCHRHRCEDTGRWCKSRSPKLSKTVCGSCCKSATNADCPVRKFNELPRTRSMGDLWRDLEEACAIDLNRLMDRVKGKWIGGSGRPEDSAAIALLDGELGFAKAFTGHEFHKWLRTIERSLSLAKKRQKFIQKWLVFDKGDLFVTFNYTTTLQHVYGISKDRICYVHGCLKNVKANLQKINKAFRNAVENRVVHAAIRFGSPELTDELAKTAIDYYKTLQKTSDEQAKALSDHLTQLSHFLRKDVSVGLASIKELVTKHCKDRSSLTEVVVAGHSLGKNDKPYFDYLAESFRYVKWRFLFYSREDLENALRFCEQHGLRGYYVPWDTADMDCVSCPADCRIP